MTAFTAKRCKKYAVNIFFHSVSYDNLPPNLDSGYNSRCIQQSVYTTLCILSLCKIQSRSKPGKSWFQYSKLPMYTLQCILLYCQTAYSLTWPPCAFMTHQLLASALFWDPVDLFRRLFLLIFVLMSKQKKMLFQKSVESLSLSQTASEKTPCWGARRKQVCPDLSSTLNVIWTSVWPNFLASSVGTIFCILTLHWPKTLLLEFCWTPLSHAGL